MGALKWVFIFKVPLSSAKPTQQLTQSVPLFQVFWENTEVDIILLRDSYTSTVNNLATKFVSQLF